MNRVMHSARVTAVASARDRYDLRDPAYQAYQILHVGFTVAPIIAGADKFFHLLVNWDNYLAPVVNSMLGGHGHTFMRRGNRNHRGNRRRAAAADIRVRGGGMVPRDHPEPAAIPAVTPLPTLRRRLT